MPRAAWQRGGVARQGGVHSLPLFLRLQGEPVILIGTGPVADARRRLLDRAGARIVEETDDARVGFVALEEGVEPVAARLKARGLLINVADRPELCDFTLPAIVDREPVIVAIGTGGASAGLAAALRQRLEAILPASLGALAHALHRARPEIAKRLPDSADRRRAIAALIAPDGPLDPLQDHGDPDPLAALSTPRGACLERIAINSPDPDELTLRAARLLGRADRLYLPPDFPAAIADRARADAVRIVGPAPAFALPGLSVELTWTPR